MTQSILLFGKSGQVGWELQRSLSVLGHVTALDFDSQDHCGDFSNPDGIVQAVRALRPDVIVNAAAHTAVDKAESEPELAQLLNATTPGVLAEEAARSRAWLVHYSTDYVFDGSGSRPWVETDRPAPLSVYGRTKWEGEQRIQQSGAKHLILRTSWVYAARGATTPDLARPRLASLLPPDALHGLEAATALLADAIADHRHIVVVGDFDCDGATACAVGVRGLRMLGARRVSHAVPNRMVHGYGLSPALVEELKKKALVIVPELNYLGQFSSILRSMGINAVSITQYTGLPFKEQFLV